MFCSTKYTHKRKVDLKTQSCENNRGMGCLMKESMNPMSAELDSVGEDALPELTYNASSFLHAYPPFSYTIKEE